MRRGLAFSEDLVSEENLARVRALNEIAQSRGQSLAQLALAWVLRDRRVTSALIGASSVRQLEQNLATLGNLELSPDELDQIDRHAVDGALNIWASSSEASRVEPRRCGRPTPRRRLAGGRSGPRY